MSGVRPKKAVKVSQLFAIEAARWVLFPVDAELRGVHHRRRHLGLSHGRAAQPEPHVCGAGLQRSLGRCIGLFSGCLFYRWPLLGEQGKPAGRPFFLAPVASQVGEGQFPVTLFQSAGPIPVLRPRGPRPVDGALSRG